MPTADELIGSEVVQSLLRSIRSSTGRAVKELEAAQETLDGLSLRERSDRLRDALLADVPGDYWALQETLRRASTDPEFRGWLIWPVTSAVVTRAAQEESAESFQDALELLAELTNRLTSEFAIRTLLRQDLKGALATIQGWAESEDEHVRRLASEGTRPYLPWAVRVPELTASPGITIPLLDALYRDESEYVRRSVANHLNDLSRDAPELILKTAGRWLEAPAETTMWVVRHGLRTLIKKGYPGALELLGFGPVSADIDGPHVAESEVPWGGSVKFSATVRNTGTESAKLAIDYIIHHRKANGAQSAKTFKLTTRTLDPGESMIVEREHSFRAITTRRYYAGPHAVALQVNGQATEPVSFDLRGPEKS